MSETLTHNDGAGSALNGTRLADIPAAVAAIQLNTEHYAAVQAVLSAVQSYDGSAKAGESTLEMLVVLEQVIEGFRRPRLQGEDDQTWTRYRARYEHEFMAHALVSDPKIQAPQPEGVALPANLSIFGLLHYIGGDYWIRAAGAAACRPTTVAEVVERQTALLRALENAGATVVPLNRVAVPPEPNQAPQTGSGAGCEASEFDDRTAKILKLLKDTFNIDAEDLLLRTAEVDDQMVRQVPYLAIEIVSMPGKDLPYPQICGKQILVCDEVENATFVSHYFLAPLEIATYGKDVLEHYCGATRVVMIESAWEDELTAALMMPSLEGHPVLTPEQIQQHRKDARQAIRLTPDLIWYYALRHFLDEGKFPSGDVTPNGFPEGEKWSTWLGGLEKGQRGLIKSTYGDLCAKHVFRLMQSQTVLAAKADLPLDEAGNPLHDGTKYLQGLDNHPYPTYESGILLLPPEWEQHAGTTGRTLQGLDQALGGFSGGHTGLTNLISLYMVQGVLPALTQAELFNICIDHIRRQRAAKQEMQFPINSTHTSHPKLPSKSWHGMNKLLILNLFEDIHSLTEIIRWGLVQATKQFYRDQGRHPNAEDFFPEHSDFRWRTVLSAVPIKNRPTFDELVVLAKPKEAKEAANSPQTELWQNIIDHVNANGAWPYNSSEVAARKYITWRAINAQIRRHPASFSNAASLANFIQIRVAAILPQHIQQHGPILTERTAAQDAFRFGDSDLTEGQVMAACFGNNIRMRSAYTEIFRSAHEAQSYSFTPIPVSEKFAALQSKASRQGNKIQAELRLRHAKTNQGADISIMSPTTEIAGNEPAIVNSNPGGASLEP